MFDGAQGKWTMDIKSEEHNRNFKKVTKNFIKVKEAEVFEKQKIVLEIKKRRQTWILV